MALLIAADASRDPMLSPTFSQAYSTVQSAPKWRIVIGKGWHAAASVGIVHAVPLWCPASTEAVVAVTEIVRLLFGDHLSNNSVMKDE